MLRKIIFSFTLCILLAQEAVSKLNSFCENPTADSDFDIQFVHENRPKGGVYIPFGDKVARQHWSQFILGKQLDSDEDFSQLCARIGFNVTDGKLQAHFRGFGSHANVKCVPLTDGSGGYDCFYSSNINPKYTDAAYTFPAYVDRKDFHSYVIIVYCYKNGDVGWIVDTIKKRRITEEDKAIILEQIESFGFDPKDTVELITDACDEDTNEDTNENANEDMNEDTMKQSQYALRKPNSFCENPTTDPDFDVQFVLENRPKDGVYIPFGDKVARQHWSQYILGKQLSSDEDFSRLCARIGFNFTDGKLQAHYQGYGSHANVKCVPLKDGSGGYDCLYSSQINPKYTDAAHIFPAYVDKKDFRSYHIVVYCYSNGDAGWAVNTIKRRRITEEDKATILEQIESFGFDPKDTVELITDACDEDTMKQSEDALIKPNSFCENPTTDPDFDVQFLNENKPAEGVYIPLGDKVARQHWSEFILGKQLSSDEDFSKLCGRIALNITNGKVKAQFRGFGTHANAKCVSLKDGSGGYDCLYTSEINPKYTDAAQVYFPFVDKKDFRSYFIQVYCFKNGDAGWIVDSIKKKTITEEDKATILENIESLGFDPKDTVEFISDACDEL